MPKIFGWGVSFGDGRKLVISLKVCPPPFQVTIPNTHRTRYGRISPGP